MCLCESKCFEVKLAASAKTSTNGDTWAFEAPCDMRTNTAQRCCLPQVAAGSDLFISVWNLHRSPAIWERPNDFDPDRFPVNGPTPTEVTHNFAYLPFGGGRRKCIGACHGGTT